MKVFLKNVNNNSKLISFKNNRSNLGKVKYLPPYFQEWKNALYFFDKNKIKDIPVNNNIINNIIQSYFNLYFITNDFSGLNSIYFKKARFFLRKIYNSKVTIKFTNARALVTIYIMNVNKIALQRKYLDYSMYQIWTKYFNLSDKNLLINNEAFSLFNFINNKLKLRFLLLNHNNSLLEYSFSRRYINYKFELLDNNLKIYNLYIKLYLSKIIKFIFYKKLILLRKYRFLYLLNKYKLNNLYLLSSLNFTISKLINKKVDFNLINLKSITYNTDILTNVLTIKLRKKSLNLLKSMKTIINKVRLPLTNSLKEKNIYINKNLLDNKHKNKNLLLNINNINLNTFLLIRFMKRISFSKNTFYPNIFLQKNNFYVYNTIFKNIKYKNIEGIRLEIKGRLTKRYRADRAIYKLFWKGGLKNLDFSSISFLGYKKPNMSYSIYKSKRRIGAFAIKGWISGK